MQRLPLRFESLSAGLLPRSRSTSRRPWDRITRSRLSMVFLGSRESSELVSNVSQKDSYAALPKSGLNDSLTVSYVMDFLQHCILFVKCLWHSLCYSPVYFVVLWLIPQQTFWIDIMYNIFKHMYIYVYVCVCVCVKFPPIAALPTTKNWPRCSPQTKKISSSVLNLFILLRFSASTHHHITFFTFQRSTLRTGYIRVFSSTAKFRKKYHPNFEGHTELFAVFQIVTYLFQDFSPNAVS